MKNYLIYSLPAIALGLSCQPPSLSLNAVTGLISTLLFSYILTKHPITIKSGLCFGFVLSAVQFHWVTSVFKLFTENSFLTSLLFALLMYIIASLQFGFFAFIYNKLEKLTWLSPALHLPLAWTIAEILYPKFIPWSQGATMIAFAPLIKIADLGGLPLVSFALFWLASLTTKIFKPSSNNSGILNRIKFDNLLLITTIISILWAYSSCSNNAIDLEERGSKKINIAIIQPNFDPNKDYAYDQLPRRAQLLRDLTKEALSKSDTKPDLVIWPESAVGYTFYPEETRLEATDLRLPDNSLKVPLIFGGQVQLGKVYTEDTKFHNSALVLFPDGNLMQAYYKEVLFPFSEQTPLASVFPALEYEFRPISNYERGFASKTNSITIGRVIIGLRICFEDIWPELFRKNVLRDNANLLVSLSSDGWFAKTSALYQHHLLAPWRAVENSRYLVRVGNNGISELVSPSGKIIASLPPEEIASTVLQAVPLLESKTLYTTYGLEVFWGIIFLIVLTDFLLNISLGRWFKNYY